MDIERPALDVGRSGRAIARIRGQLRLRCRSSRWPGPTNDRLLPISRPVFAYPPVEVLGLRLLRNENSQRSQCFPLRPRQSSPGRRARTHRIVQRPLCCSSSGVMCWLLQPATVVDAVASRRDSVQTEFLQPSGHRPSAADRSSLRRLSGAHRGIQSGNSSARPNPRCRRRAVATIGYASGVARGAASGRTLRAIGARRRTAAYRACSVAQYFPVRQLAMLESRLFGWGR